MWACALGHTEAATVLYRIHQGALHVCNREGATCVHLAQQHGHFALVQHLANLQMALQMHVQVSETAPLTVGSVSTNDGLVSAPPSGRILRFVNAPVASSTPRVVNRSVPVAHVEPRGAPHIEPLGTPHGAPLGAPQGAPLGAAPPANTTAFAPPPLWRISDSKQLTIEIPVPLTLVSQLGQRGASVPRSLPGAAPAVSGEGATLQRRFMKRTSIDVLPNYGQLQADQDSATGAPSVVTTGMRSVNSDPYLARLEAAHDPDPMISVSGRDVNSPDMFMQTDYHHAYDDSFSLDDDLQQESAMDTGTRGHCNNIYIYIYNVHVVAQHQ